MSHPLNLLQELLQTLFLALGCAWFAIDLARKLRAPQSADEPRPAPVPVAERAAAAPARPEPAATVAPAPVPAHVPAPAHAPVAAPVVSDGALPQAHLAAIAAAVHHLFRGRTRVAGIVAGAPASFAAVDWAREGRRDIFTSHRVR